MAFNKRFLLSHCSSLPCHWGRWGHGLLFPSALPVSLITGIHLYVWIQTISYSWGKYKWDSLDLFFFLNKSYQSVSGPMRWFSLSPWHFKNCKQFFLIQLKKSEMQNLLSAGLDCFILMLLSLVFIVIQYSYQCFSSQFLISCIRRLSESSR